MASSDIGGFVHAGFLAPVEGVPVEIQVEILCQSPSLNNLQNFISASPRFLQVFLSNKQTVLNRILRKDLGPEVLHEARYLVKALKNPAPVYQKVVDFMDAYLQNAQSGCHVKPLKLATSLAICEQHKAVQYHLHKLSDTARQSMNKCMQAMPAAVNVHIMSRWPVGIMPLSYVETTRIRRALYRFELFSVLFYRRNETPVRSKLRISMSAQEAIFLAKLSPWEVEEIACVHHYFQSSLGEMFDRVEDQFVDICQSPDPSAALHQLETDRKVIAKDFHRAGTIREPLLNGQQRLFDFHGRFQFFTSFAKAGGLHEDVIENLSSSGLRPLGVLLGSTDIQVQMRRVVRMAAIASQPTFANAYNIYNQKVATRVAEWPDMAEWSQDDNGVAMPNAGYRWLRKALEDDNSGTYPSRHKGGLRSLGYPFWSEARLDACNLLEYKLKKVIDACKGLKNGPRKDEPSAEFHVKKIFEERIWGPANDTMAAYLDGDQI